jgi:c-di-GMP-binding flagellar brake protein YcgR
MQVNSHGDLRQWERERVAIPVGLVLKSGELKSDITTATINFSLSGVGVLTKLALVPRQEVAIIILGNFLQTIRARVVWVREDECSNSVIAGLKFLVY